MNSRNKGIIIITAACIVAVITSAVFGFKYAKAKEQLETLQAQDCTEHEKTIARLNQEVQQLQDKVNAADSNNETDISEKALFFLLLFIVIIRPKI